MTTSPIAINCTSDEANTKLGRSCVLWCETDMLQLRPFPSRCCQLQSIQKRASGRKIPPCLPLVQKNHIKSYESEFSTLPGDPSKAYTTYGPESVAVAVNPKNAPAEEEDDMDLFGSDEEEEDPEVVAEREKRLADYKKKKEGKAKPAAKSIVTLDVKP